MGLQQQYEELKALRSEIDGKLNNLDFQKIKELILWQAKSEDFKKLHIKDTQLSMLAVFCEIWADEKKKLVEAGIWEDIFYKVDSLQTLEQKYLTVQFGLLRLETPMPVEYYEQAVDDLIAYRVSGIALYRLIMRETACKEQNILKLAGLLKEKEQITTARFLLQYGRETYPGNEEILLELADCWLEEGNLEQSYECLKQMQSPSMEIQELIGELENAISQ
ncbi:MAG: tetratricopeptide repeat protein [Lachnospiraceae bacterium]|nr:tetratricopeptide repeat protein [Lachnospiraceae bacterium]